MTSPTFPRRHLPPRPLPRHPESHCGIVPPYLLEHLAGSDDEALSATGRQTLLTDAKLRRQRSQVATGHEPVLGADTATKVVHSAGNSETLPGKVVRSAADQPSGDPAVDEAWDWTGQVLALYADAFDRNSVDGEGGLVTVTVHYGTNYDNAFWNGSQLVFGDGDQVVFDRFTKPIDVLAHEFTHGVTQFTAALTYQGQSGALNESVSDCFGSMTKQRFLGQTATQADWLIGEGLFVAGINGKALRSMLAPGTAYDDPKIGKDPQVGSMDDYVTTTEDSGGVHINSGIPNRAFALAASAIGGNTWEMAGRVWYDTLTGGQVTASSDFAAFARATVSSAARLFADDASVAQKVRDAWATVKVLPAADVPVDAAAPAGSGDPTVPKSGDTVAVRRTGGVAGITRSAELDLDADPSGPEVRRLLAQADLQQIATSSPSADHFVYTVEYGDVRLTVPEHALTPELHRVVRLVLDPAGNDLT